MIDNAHADVAEIGVRLFDEAYLAWLSAESDCEIALRAWFEAARPGRRPAYLAYRAALDREEAAALDLKRLWELSEPCRQSLVGERTR